MNWLTLFKRTKAEPLQAENPLKSDWAQKQYEQNVIAGVRSLQEGREIRIYDDGRGYELALEIKHRFILERQKQLSEKIKIDKSANGLISLHFIN